MITLGEIVRQYGAAYRARYGEQMLPSQAAALHAIEACRTEALGGRVYRCEGCQTTHYRILLLPQPSLSAMPARCCAAVAGAPGGLAAARAIFPDHLQTAFGLA